MTRSQFDTPERLTVGIYDPDAQCTDLVSFVLKYTGNVCIITDNEDVFYDELNTIAEETGACAVVTHHREQLSNCDLVIWESHFFATQKSCALTADCPINFIEIDLLSATDVCKLFYAYAPCPFDFNAHLVPSQPVKKSPYFPALFRKHNIQ